MSPKHSASTTKPQISSGARATTLKAFLLIWSALMISGSALAEEIGSVDTKFNLLSPDDSISVASFVDPAIDGVVCYLSRAQKGGYRGALGLAEDTSDASIDCRQVGPIHIKEPLKKGEPAFRERRSFLFKSLKVVRFCDEIHNSIVYLAYSEKVIEGSPKNSVSAVPIRPWGKTEDSVAACRYGS